MPKLELSRFVGLEHPRLYQDPAHLDAVRTAFAAEITAYAAQCRTKGHLLDALYGAMPPESGFDFPRKIGEGSTRKAYQLPFDLVLKLERTDSLSPEEMKMRGSRAYLDNRRRISTLCEMTTAIVNPGLMTRIYGVMLALGPHPNNIACMISEQVTPLVCRDPDDDDELDGLLYEQLAVSTEGRLKILYDDRFPGCTPALDDRPLRTVIPSGEEGVNLSNIGRDLQGRYKLIDSGNVSWKGCHLDSNYLPVVPNTSGGTGWTECNPMSVQHQSQTAQLCKELMYMYELSLVDPRLVLTGLQPRTNKVADS